jgi:hypothetical protein
MSDYIQKLIYDLMLFRRSSYTSTKAFSKLKHNDDLCPRFEKQIELIFYSFEKYRRITYDIQGFRDQGTDIIARLPVADDYQFICFQIKSEGDLKEANYLKTLKSQVFDTESTYQKLLDYYVVLCPDMNDWEAKRKRDLKTKRETGREDQSPPPIDKNKQNQIRTIKAEFANRQTSIHIIDPEYAITFLSLTSVQIDAAIKNKLGAEDIVFRKTLELIETSTATERALLFYLVWLRIYRSMQTILPDEIYASPWLRDIYEVVRSEDWEYQSEEERERFATPGSIQERITNDLEHLEDNFIESNVQGEYTLDLKYVDPLVVLMMDGNIRYGYEVDELLIYMMNLFGPVEGYEPQQADLLTEA